MTKHSTQESPLSPEEIVRLEEKTKANYVEQHKTYPSDDRTWKRFTAMVGNLNYFHLTPEQFKGMHVLDGGCGNSGYFPLTMMALGAGKVTCLDLGQDWIPFQKEAIQMRGGSLENIDFVSGSIVSLPFPDETFDLTCANGVLMHLITEEQIESAFKELARVTKKGGYFYSILGVPGGLMEEFFIPGIREFYHDGPKHKPEFKELIDNLSIERLKNFLHGNNIIRQKMGDKPLPVELIMNFIDIDYLTFLQNIIKVPCRYIFKMNEAWAESRYAENGFIDLKRCKRYISRENIRTIFSAPQYAAGMPDEFFDDPSSINSDALKELQLFSSLFFGRGNLEYIAQKA